MSAGLSHDDQESLKQLLSVGILRHYHGKNLETGNGVILVSCSDGDKILDFLDYIRTLIHEGGGKLRPHIFTEHGGAMIIAEDCPLYREEHADTFMLRKISDAVDMKGIETVILLVHAPCGAAAKVHMSLVQQLALLVRAKARVESAMPKLRVAGFIHIHHEDGKKETYFVEPHAFETWTKTHVSHASDDPLNDLFIHPNQPGNYL